jgi:hypothetical protein
MTSTKSNFGGFLQHQYLATRIANPHHQDNAIPPRTNALQSLRIPSREISRHSLEKVVTRAQTLWRFPCTETVPWNPPQVDNCVRNVGESYLAIASSPCTFTSTPDEAQTNPSINHQTYRRIRSIRVHLDFLSSLYQKAGRPGSIPTFLVSSTFPEAEDHQASAHGPQSAQCRRTWWRMGVRNDKGGGGEGGSRGLNYY